MDHLLNLLISPFSLMRTIRKTVTPFRFSVISPDIFQSSPGKPNRHVYAEYHEFLTSFVHSWESSPRYIVYAPGNLISCCVNRATTTTLRSYLYISTVPCEWILILTKKRAQTLPWDSVGLQKNPKS